MWATVGLGVLYFWLRGHWFARVLAFVFFVPTLVVLFGKLPLETVPEGFAYLAGCTVIAWLISGLPAYYYRKRSLTAGAGLLPLPPLRG